MLTKEEILGAEDLKTEEVPVPEWGGSVMVREMSALEREEFRAVSVAEDGSVNPHNFAARLAAATICDGRGNRLFGLEEAEALGRKSARALTRVADVAMRLSAIERRTAENLAGNSSAGQSDDSPSD